MIGPIQVAMMMAKHQKQLHTGQCLRLSEGGNSSNLAGGRPSGKRISGEFARSKQNGN